MYSILDFDDKNKNCFNEWASFKKNLKNKRLNNKFNYINNNKLNNWDIQKYRELSNLKKLHENYFNKYKKFKNKIEKIKNSPFDTILPNDHKNNMKLKNRYDEIFKDEDNPIKPEFIIDGIDFNNFDSNLALKNLKNKKTNKVSLSDKLDIQSESKKNYFICKNHNILNKLIPNIYNTVLVYQEDIIEFIIDELIQEEVELLNQIEEINRLNN